MLRWRSSYVITSLCYICRRRLIRVLYERYSHFFLIIWTYCKPVFDHTQVGSDFSAPFATPWRVSRTRISDTLYTYACLYSAYPPRTHTRTRARRYTRASRRRCTAVTRRTEKRVHRRRLLARGVLRAPADPRTQRPDGRRRWIVVCNGGSGQAPERRCENPKTVKSVAGR